MYILTVLLNILLAYLLFFPIIFTHELGHALVARLLDFKVFYITIGYGKRLLEFEILGFPIQLNLIPLQGITFAIPKTKKLFKLRMWFYIWGGLISHVLLVFLFYLILGEDEFFASLHPRNIFIHFAPITAFIYANVFIFLINILPQKLNLPTGVDFTDGYKLLILPFKKSVGLDELNLIFEEMRAIEYLKREEYDKALEIYKILQNLKPDNFLFDLSIGHIQLAQGNLETARHLFVDVLKKLEREKADDKNYERFRYILYNNIAWIDIVYYREDLLEQADVYSRKALNSSPNFSAYLGTRGSVLIRIGKIKEGIELLKKAFKYHSENSARSAEALFIGIGQAKLGNEKEALKWLNRARKLHSNHYFFSIGEQEIIETLNKIKTK